MRPWIFTIGGYTLHAYPFFLVLAFVGASLLGLHGATRLRNLRVSPLICVWMLLGSLLGARLASLVSEGQYAAVWRAVLIWEPGMIFYGGVAGGAVAGWVYARANRLPLVPLAAAAAPAAALGEAIGRIGCLFNGCCYGSVCSWAVAIVFPRYSPAYYHHVSLGLIDATATQSLPVYPSQIFMSIALFAATPWLYRLLKRSTKDGFVCCAYLIVQGMLRFAMETMRDDMPRILGSMTASQAVSVGFVLVGCVVGGVLVLRIKVGFVEKA
ncbi:MAG: prolipoprotein diacylglyceryl transferase [Candidatus Hydrogenedentota bacterium]